MGPLTAEGHLTMLRTLSAAALLLSLAATAQAADFQTIVRAHEGVMHAKLVAAARDVCRKAIAHDQDGVYGSEDECVDNTLALAPAASAVATTYSAR